MSRKDACSRGLSSTMTEKVFLGKERIVPLMRTVTGRFSFGAYRLPYRPGWFGKDEAATGSLVQVNSRNTLEAESW
jgi:hypothetical protein